MKILFLPLMFSLLFACSKPATSIEGNWRLKGFGIHGEEPIDSNLKYFLLLNFAIPPGGINVEIKENKIYFYNAEGAVVNEGSYSKNENGEYLFNINGQQDKLKVLKQTNSLLHLISEDNLVVELQK